MYYPGFMEINGKSIGNQWEIDGKEDAMGDGQ